MATSAALPLIGSRIQIAGSAAADADQVLTIYAHELVENLVRGVLVNGGGLVLAAGKEPFPENPPEGAPSLVFDWTALETLADCLTGDFPPWPAGALPIVLVSSEKAESEIPDDRRSLYDGLIRSGRVRVERIMPGSRAAALIRQRQAAFGDALVAIGGGTGVEHLAGLYMARRKATVPVDLAIGSSRGDGTGGASRLAREARAEPARFVRLSDAFAGTEGALLAQIGTRDGAIAASDVAASIVTLLSRLKAPDAFYVRLLDHKHARFAAVESFFRDVVDAVAEEMSMNRVEVGTDRPDHAFMNVEIFERLHFSSAAIVDITGEKPNCFIELGYALGTANRVLVTAEEGTKLPFDQQAIPCHFWNATDSTVSRRQSFREFWLKQIARPPIVRG